MGDYNQLLWVKNNKGLIKPDILEIGSRKYSEDTFNDFRALFPKDWSYLGADMQLGENVDRVVDFTSNIEDIEKKIGSKLFKTVICCSVLEHVNRPWIFASNVSKVVEKGGYLFLSVPFIWEFHGYPSDYWRFTHEGVKVLFDQFHFPEESITFSSNVDFDIQAFNFGLNRFISVETDNRVPNNKKSFRELVNKISAILFSKAYRKSFVLNRLAPGNRFKKSYVNMIGIKN